MLNGMSEIDETMERRLDEHVDDVDRLRSGDGGALEDLLEACTGAKIASVTVRSLV